MPAARGKRFPRAADESKETEQNNRHEKEYIMAINLQKGQKVSLKKNSGSGLGEILVNLNWNAAPAKKKKGLLSGIFGGPKGIDLDLGCLYELKDGSKGTVQALGKRFRFSAESTLYCAGRR